MAVTLTPLPASASLASRILRLPASVAGKTLCLLDAQGQPVPLQHLERLPPQVWYYVGDPAQQSVSLGRLDLTSNVFDSNGLNESNIFYAAQFVSDNTIGPDFTANMVYGELRHCTIGSNCFGNTFRPSVTYCALGDNISNCYFDANTHHVTLGDSCQRVRLYNCFGTPQQPFVVPAGTVDAEYRNNQLVSATTLPLAAPRTADYTLALADAGCLVPVSSTSAVTVTVPAHASVPFPIGTTLYVAQDGSGAVSIAAASGVVVQTAQGYQVPEQWQDVALHKRDLNTWVLKGGVV